MDFEKLKSDLSSYIQTNFPIYINKINLIKTDYALPDPDLYILNEYPNPIKYTNNIVVYTRLQDYDLQREGNYQILNNDMVVYITIRMFPDDQLQIISDRYKEAFYNLINDDDSLGNLFDTAYITKIKDYDGMDSINNLVPIEIHFSAIKYIV